VQERCFGMRYKKPKKRNTLRRKRKEDHDVRSNARAHGGEKFTCRASERCKKKEEYIKAHAARPERKRIGRKKTQGRDRGKDDT